MNPHPHNFYDLDPEPNSHSYSPSPPPQPPLHFHRLPAGHGPKSLQTQFVKAQGQYDELGRTVEDGFEAEVGEGSGSGRIEMGKDKGKGKGKGKERERDPDALSFWRGLELDKGGSSSNPTPATDPQPGTTMLDSSTNNGAKSSTMTPQSTANTITRNRERSHPKPIIQPTPLQIPRSQWFIRRALASKARSTPTTPAPSTSATPTPEPDLERAPTSSSSSTINSIASLLDLPPPSEAGFKPPNHYHIKPNNIGWKLLERGGWNAMGGLGKPEGWEEEVERKRRERELKQEEIEGDKIGGQTDAVEVVDGEQVIDLTLGETEDESELGDSLSLNIDSEPARFGDQILDQTSLDASTSTSTSNTPLLGPGRTAPIPTYLKTDLSGIGHRPIKTYSTLTSARITKIGEAPKKRITHTAAEIRALERGKVVRALSEEGLEMKRRGRAKREMKRDREQTKRLRQLMFS